MFSPTTQYMTKMCVCTVWHVVEGLVGGAFAWEGVEEQDIWWLCAWCVGLRSGSWRRPR